MKNKSDEKRATKKRTPEKTREYHKRSREKNRPRILEKQRGYSLKNSYGMTLAEYDALFELQDGVCAICKQPETAQKSGVTKRLSVDHNHETSKIRGLLCTNCNSILGHAHENVHVLAAAMDYLSTWSS